MAKINSDKMKYSCMKKPFTPSVKIMFYGNKDVIKSNLNKKEFLQCIIDESPLQYAIYRIVTTIYSKFSQWVFGK